MFPAGSLAAEATQPGSVEHHPASRLPRAWREKARPVYIAIDDTYGPKTILRSRHVTGNRRTHLGVVFQDAEVDRIRSEIASCLQYASDLIGATLREFHFVDIYNRRRQWQGAPESSNLAIFGAFAEIYRRYRWPIEIQTIDDRTMRSPTLRNLSGKVDGLDLAKRSDLSLVMLCANIKRRYAATGQPLHLLVDQGRSRPGHKFGQKIFSDWPNNFVGQYVPSEEPLLQIVDFIAFCVNRSTILQYKDSRSELDNEFLRMVGNMNLNCRDLQRMVLPINFDAERVDLFHDIYRMVKGLDPL